MAFPIEPPVLPMLAQLAREIPRGEGWRYEPKWDGFRAIVFRDGERVHVGSRNALPLERYFPEVVEIARRALPDRCVVDGEIVVPTDHGLDFELLQLRLHPAASRVAKLSKEIPAALVPFDALADGDSDLRDRPLDERRARLVAMIGAEPDCFPTPQTDDPDEAERWFGRFEGAGLDGVVAKRSDQRYVPGKRAMVKVKHERTADCVVVGYRYGRDGRSLGSLLLGVYGRDGDLAHIGFTAAFSARDRAEVRQMLQPLVRETMDASTAMGYQSRWAQGRDLSWVSLEPTLVCEVAYDHLQGGWRFRHGARLARWRPDKDARDCTWDQFPEPEPLELDEIRRLGTR